MPTLSDKTAINLRRLRLTSARPARDTYVEMHQAGHPTRGPERDRGQIAPVLDTVIPSPGSPPLPVGYPGPGGGLWLRMVFPAGLRTWLVPSGWTVSCQPSSCSTT